MQEFLSGKASFLLPLAILSAAFAMPAQANYFHDPSAGIEHNVGSAASPTPDDLRGVYPLASQAMNEQGQVQLKLSLSEKGTVIAALVEKSSGIPRLDDAAVKYVKTYWSYEPPNGRDMPAEMLFTVKFVLP